MLIRSATPADLDEINQIYNHYVAHTVATYQEIASSPEARRQWYEAHPAHHPIIVAEIDSRVVAFAALSSFREQTAFRSTVENAIYVRQDMIGIGIGRALLADLISRARAIGHRAIIAVIDAEQTSSIRLHEQAGFVRCAQLKQVGFKFGRWLDVVYLQCLL